MKIAAALLLIICVTNAFAQDRREPQRPNLAQWCRAAQIILSTQTLTIGAQISIVEMMRVRGCYMPTGFPKP